jgi:hypothetical protein
MPLIDVTYDRMVYEEVLRRSNCQDLWIGTTATAQRLVSGA